MTTLTDDMAERIYREAFPVEDQKGWPHESDGMRGIFRDYARAAAGAIVDCQDFEEILPLLNPVVLAEAARRAREQ